MKKILLHIMLLISITSMISSCYYDIEEELYPEGSSSNCDTTNLSYQIDIRPIVDANCATSGCHVAGGSGPGDYSTYDDLVIVAQNGKLRDRVITLQNMPPSGALSSCDKLKIEHWINNGAKSN